MKKVRTDKERLDFLESQNLTPLYVGYDIPEVPKELRDPGVSYGTGYCSIPTGRHFGGNIRKDIDSVMDAQEGIIERQKRQLESIRRQPLDIDLDKTG